MAWFRRKNVQDHVGTIVINCTVEGEISAASKVVISPEGSMRGIIRADRLEVEGAVSGWLDVGFLVIRPSGKVLYEEIAYDELQVEGTLEPADRSAVMRSPRRADQQAVAAPDRDEKVTAEPVVAVEKPVVMPEQDKSKENDKIVFYESF
ncbi:MAG TPA: polymer-forming cytoskeletal protein [Firmicutes bacterium]|jgi:hypothetical protein|nr:polymer-forming cytoskeletal protein [Bacillota bacterium]